jgi:hypothetical protein
MGLARERALSTRVGIDAADRELVAALSAFLAGPSDVHQRAVLDAAARATTVRKELMASREFA